MPGQPGDPSLTNPDKSASRLPSAALVPMAWIEHATSPLPRECSTTELHGRVLQFFPGVARASLLQRAFVGAGEGNRTLVVSLEGFCSTSELHPRVQGSEFGNQVSDASALLPAAQFRARTIANRPVRLQIPAALHAPPPSPPIPPMYLIPDP